MGYVNEAGVEEKGIDVGGLFKDFWSDLSAQAFSPGYSLFASIEGGSLYPSPIALKAHGETDGVMLFTFLGRIVGKGEQVRSSKERSGEDLHLISFNSSLRSERSSHLHLISFNSPLRSSLGMR